MVGLDEGYEVGVVGVVVFDEYSFVLETDDRNAVSIVFRERSDCKTKGGSGA